MHRHDHDRERRDLEHPYAPCAGDDFQAKGWERELSSTEVTRRRFLGITLGGLCMASLEKQSWASSPSSSGGMQYRTLGRSGEKVSLVGIGGAHLGRTRDEAGSVTHRALGAR